MDKVEILKELQKLKRETGYIGNALDLVKRDRQNKILDKVIEIVKESMKLPKKGIQKIGNKKLLKNWEKNHA